MATGHGPQLLGPHAVVPPVRRRRSNKTLTFPANPEPSAGIQQQI